MLVGLIIGMFIGAILGATLMAALQLAKRSDRDYEDDAGVDWEDGRPTGSSARPGSRFREVPRDLR